MASPIRLPPVVHARFGVSYRNIESARRKIMKSLCVLLCVVLLATATPAQNTNASTTAPQNMTGSKMSKRRGPVFRATKDQIMQAQTMLKTRGLYSGDATGKLDPTTRAALKKYQEAEGVRVTGTLNRATLEKMGIELTERQRAM